MPFFTKRGGSPNAGNKLVGGRGRHGMAPFRFGIWLRLHGVDIITMAVMGAVGLGVYFAGTMNAM